MKSDANDAELKPMKLEEIPLGLRNPNDKDCPFCSLTQTLLTKKGDFPEYYTEVYLQCQCGEYIEFVLPVNSGHMKWIKCSERLPDKMGRYLVLETFTYPCISNDNIVRKYVPFVSNYLPGKGWMISLPEIQITHWMEIPELEGN